MIPFLSPYVDLVMSMSLAYLPQLILAVIVLLVGFRLVGLVTLAMEKALSIQRVDPSLRSFMESAVSIVLKGMIIISVASMIGVQVTSFIALLGAAGLAVGLSLQGSLSNLAGGFLILFFKPFEVGQEIEAQGQKGVVERIEMFTTIVRNPEGKMVIMPNGPLSNSVIVNASRRTAPSASSVVDESKKN